MHSRIFYAIDIFNILRVFIRHNRLKDEKRRGDKKWEVNNRKVNKSKIVSIAIAVTVVFSILLALSATTSACHHSLTANVGGPYTGIVGESITFDGSASSAYCLGSYKWDFGDGNTATGITPTHAYTATGDYTVTLTVKDCWEFSDSDTATVTVSQQIPEFTTIAIPVASILGLLFYFNHRKQRKEN